MKSKHVTFSTTEKLKVIEELKASAHIGRF
jgi:hypothetical protein